MFPLMLCCFHLQTLNGTVFESVLGNWSDGTMDRVRVQRGQRKMCPLAPPGCPFSWASYVQWR